MMLMKSGESAGKFSGTLFTIWPIGVKTVFWNMECMELMNTTGFSAI